MWFKTERMLNKTKVSMEGNYYLESSRDRQWEKLNEKHYIGRGNDVLQVCIIMCTWSRKGNGRHRTVAISESNGCEFAMTCLSRM
jgi:hypothetical protein